MAATITIADQVRQIIGKHLGCEPHRVTDDAELRDDLGADGLDSVELAMKVEEAFDITLTDDEVERWETVGDVIASVERRR